ncbi:hypothetical protein ACFE04_030414 [Oxalis oulophora]
MSLKCALELGIPDIIHKHGQPMILSKLVSVLEINSEKIDCVYRLMRVLTHSGFFSQKKVDNSEEFGYVLTNASYLLLKDNPLSVLPFSMMAFHSSFLKPWESLSTWFKNDDPTPYYTAHKKLIWDLFGDEPKINKLFNDGMASDSHFVASIVIKKCQGVFERLKSLVDVGGGTGTMANAIAQAFPDLKCIVLDLPHVVANLKDDSKLKFVGGDMFEAIPSANGVLLKFILHDWNDEECVQILKNCKDAITKHNNKEGKVILIDTVIGSISDEIECSLEVQLLLDMDMMALVTGKERTEKELAKIFKDAGFKNYKIYPILGARSLIEVYP